MADTDEPATNRLATREGRPGSGARLTALGGQLLGRHFVLGATVVLGRGATSAVCVDDTDVSRSHAEVRRLPDGTYEIVDLGSRNGTFLNGDRISRAPLSFGDRIRVGGTVFLFSPHDPLSEELMQRDRLETVGRLSTGIAHDLNNALCVIKSMAALLLDEAGMDASARAECLDDVLTASVRAERLAKRMLAFVRGHDEPARVIELRSVADDVAQLVRRLLPEEVTLSVQVEPGLYVFGESTQLLQVFLNLVINARDAIVGAGVGGKIDLVGTREGGDVVARVVDDGSGMPDDVAARVFEPFFTTKGSRGSGIGLATVREIVENHGGRISVTSTLGSGTTFTVRLRAHERGAEARRGTLAKEMVTPMGAGQRVLVVDRDLAARRATLRLLHRTGYLVSEASTCVDAGDRITAVDVVLLDLDQAATCLGVLGSLDQSSEKRPLLVATSASDRDAATEKVRALGASGLVLKPFTRAEILVAIHHALSSAGLIDEDDTFQNRRSR
jgi:signal transduction histidine kinase/ActR/RegA family two-component response regulator